MTYILDSNTLIRLLAGDRRVTSVLRQTGREQVAIPAIVWFELTFGALKSANVTENLARLDHLRLAFLPFDQADARQAGQVRFVLSGRGTPIGPYDTLIAGQALARNLTLVTHNTREFSRVPGLRIEDWEL